MAKINPKNRTSTAETRAAKAVLKAAAPEAIFSDPPVEPIDTAEVEPATEAWADCAYFLEEESSPDPTDLYLREIGASPLLTKEEEVYYARRIQKGDMAAKKRMIESNLRLVVKIARRYLRCGMPILDLIEEGNIGLMRAVDKFDPERGFRFSTYGAWWIQQSIERAIMSQNRTVRLPVHVSKRLNRCLRTSRELSKDSNTKPKDHEIAFACGNTTEEIKVLLSLNEKIVSIDSNISEEVPKPLLDTLSSHRDDPIENLQYVYLKKHIVSWLAHLNKNQRAVIERRFGLNGHDAVTLEQTGLEIGLTRERVRQLQAEALKKLKVMISAQCGGPHIDSFI